jgi:tetratricopeptide (TPR) repeat protein
VTRAIGLALLLSAASVRAQPDEPAPPAAPAEDPAFAEHLATAQKFYEAGDFIHARVELLVAYKIKPASDVLFALGQVEFNLKHYAKAIEYYEQFSSTNLDPERQALAQQAIGAARIELSRPAPKPPLPPPHREWDGTDTGLVVTSGVLGAAGGGLLYYAHHLSQDRTGALHDYDNRIQHARIVQWAAAGSFAAGTAVLGAALLRWRFHMVETKVEVHPTAGGVAFSLEHPL